MERYGAFLDEFVVRGVCVELVSGENGTPYRFRCAFSETGSRRGGPSVLVRCPSGITATGTPRGAEPVRRKESVPPSTGSVVSVDPRPERMRGQQQVLDGGEDGGVQRLGEGQPCVPAHDDEDGGVGHAPHGALVHVGEEGGRETPKLEVSGAALPDTRR